jgi:hypothetical protein
MSDQQSESTAVARELESAFGDRWGIWLSETGRWWASRRTPITGAGLSAGCVPHLRADTPEQLTQHINAQEELSARASHYQSSRRTVPDPDPSAPPDPVSDPARPIELPGRTAPLGRSPGPPRLPYAQMNLLDSDGFWPGDTSAAVLAALRDEFPGYRIWRELAVGQVHYVACRLHPGSHPHTFMTPDPDKLRTALREGQA